MQGRFHPVISRQLITDSSQLQRETKISRINGENDSSYPCRRTSRNTQSSIISDARVSPRQRYSGHDYKWRGIISKNGNFLCRVVCVPIGS
ncbi:hypothetical protein KY290_027567 [Solanum tuberosum]|uniref:Uncharacterized protein n=1 Tax=Solanum tuberosum TaxID=4113 RepID=A0ABQ7UFF3_SOLTU|nr:hypothetical protein KY290_027567 [Solanum tuberosum]